MLSMLMTTEYAPAEDRHELQQLLIHIAGGEREALAELYQRTRSAVYGLALSYLKNAHDAQDLTQDVYVQVWDCAEQYRLTGSPMGWLLAVCRNLCLTRLRREERHAALSEEDGTPFPRGSAVWTPTSVRCCKAHWQASLTRSGASCCSTLLRA